MAHAHLNGMQKQCPDKIWYQRLATYCPQFLLMPFWVSLIESDVILALSNQKKPHIMPFQERIIICGSVVGEVQLTFVSHQLKQIFV